MAEQQIHELPQTVVVSGNTLLVVSNGTKTYKAQVSQIPMNLPVRTTEDPMGVEGSIRAHSFNPSTGIGWNPGTLGRSGIAWRDGTSWHGVLDNRDVGRRLYRRLVSSDSSFYTLTEQDVQYGLTILYAGTSTKTISVPSMPTSVVPTTALPAHGALGVRRRIEIIQAGSGGITLTPGDGLTGLYGVSTTDGDNQKLVIEYDTTTEARVWRVG